MRISILQVIMILKIVIGESFNPGVFIPIYAIWLEIIYLSDLRNVVIIHSHDANHIKEIEQYEKERIKQNG